MCVTRAAADLPSFHGVSRKKLVAWPATQVQSGGGIFDTGKPTGIRWRESTRSMVDLSEGAWVLRDIPAMAVGDRIGAEQSNRPGASQQGVAVVSERALERTRGSSLPEALSDKQVHTTHKETRADTQFNRSWAPDNAIPLPIC
jgi:hypothetical protein